MVWAAILATALATLTGVILNRILPDEMTDES
jgi:hypothetical protein